jgi:hypothetical protein
MAEPELVFEIPEAKHEPFTCPDHGQVKLYPYVSGGAFSAYYDHRDNPRAAFLAMARESLDQAAVADKFSEADCDAIARLYAGTLDCGDTYEAARSKEGVYNAFRTALQSTASWKSYLEEERQITAYLERTILPVMRILDGHKALVNQSLKAASYLRVPDYLLQVPAFALPVQSALFGLRSQALLPGLETINALAASTKLYCAEWDRMQGLTQNLFRHERLFTEHTRWITQLANQTEQMRRLLEPVPDITRMLRTATAQLGAAGFNEEVLAQTDAAIGTSIGVIVGTNDYFSRQGGLISPAVRPALPDEASPEEREASRAVADSTQSAESVLHDETAGVLLAGNKAADFIADLVDRRLNKRFAPFAHLLARIERLSKAGTFFQLLSTFATVFARDFWKSLWVKPGDAYVSKPEGIAQAMLGMFLHGHWSGLAFVGREITNGDGYVDLLVNFLGQDHVVELKMLGAGWGIGYVKDGLEQLDAYMKNLQSPEAFLVVFDGRKTQKGEQLNESYALTHGTVHVVTVRAYFEAPSK